MFLIFQVAGLFGDASIGNAINVVVVRLILLEQDEVKITVITTTKKHASNANAALYAYMHVCRLLVVNHESIKQQKCAVDCQSQAEMFCLTPSSRAA